MIYCSWKDRWFWVLGGRKPREPACPIFLSDRQEHCIVWKYRDREDHAFHPDRDVHLQSGCPYEVRLGGRSYQPVLRKPIEREPQLAEEKLNIVLIMDEFGYEPYDRSETWLLFDYLSDINKQVFLNKTRNFRSGWTSFMLSTWRPHWSSASCIIWGLYGFPATTTICRNLVLTQPFQKPLVRRLATMVKNNDLIKV